MTIATAWIRDVKGCEELVIVTDSRVTGAGWWWDCATKIMPLPREDSFICFAGDTMYAYPMMLHLSSMIESYPKLLNRNMDLHDLRGHTINVFNNIRDSVFNYVEGEQYPQLKFILGGYSWIRKTFSIWLIAFDMAKKEFVFSSLPKHRKRKVWFIGDDEYVKEARQKLNQLLLVRNKLNESLDMEPFEVIRDMLRLHSKDPRASIGGPPQFVKIYQYIHAQPFGVLWPNKKSRQITVLGRNLLDYEQPNYPVLDPDELIATRLDIKKKDNSDSE
jgi:hypothetical protein